MSEQTVSAFDVVRSFVHTERVVSVQLKDNNGQEHTFRIKRFVSVADMAQMTRKIDGRIKTLKANQNKIDVFVPADIVENYESYFDDAEPSKRDAAGEEVSYKIAVLTEEEVQVATTLELGLDEPALDWAMAVVYTRIAAPLAFKLVNLINEHNSGFAVEDAKNG